MKNRRGFLLAMVAGLMAAAVIITPVIADELFGAITKVDVDGKKLTVVEKGSDKEVVVTTTADTEYVSGKGETSKIDLESLSKKVAKAADAGKKTMVKITHEKGVASKIESAKKKAG
jgi:biopolymer transport protein ExbD